MKSEWYSAVSVKMQRKQQTCCRRWRRRRSTSRPMQQ